MRNALIVTGASIVLTCLFIVAVRSVLPDQPPPSWPEIIATATGLACVWLTRLEDPWCWPIGIISALLIAWTFWGYDLPGQALLNLVYFTPVQVYGWWMWTRRHAITQKPFVRVSALDAYNNGRLIGHALGATAFLGLGLWLAYQGDMQQRLWDSSIAVASIVAQWLLNRKRVEAWWWWLIPVNVSSVVLFWHQGAYLYSLMYVVFGVHAVIAIRDWGKTCRTAS